MTLACEGIRVPDFGQGYGAIPCMILADYGADVLKVEPPGGESYRGKPAWFCQNSGRRYRGDDSRFVLRSDYAAAISAVNACHLARKTRRFSDNDTCLPTGGRIRKY